MGIKFDFSSDNTVLDIADGERDFRLFGGGGSDEIQFNWTEDYPEICFSIAKLDNFLSAEFPNGLSVRSFFNHDDLNFVAAVWIIKSGDVLEISFDLNVGLDEWQRPYKASLYLNALEDKFNALGYVAKQFDDGNSSIDLYLEVSLAVETDSIYRSIIECAGNVGTECALVEHRLLEALSTDLLIKLFRFPSEYEIICSQYLLWFGELLKSLGIDASVSTANKDGQTFLSIEPKDNTVLTSEIEKILYLYLALPYSEYIPAETVTANHVAKMQYQQLHNQVQMLNQQVEFKTSMLELEELKRKEQSSELVEVKGKLLLLESLQDSKFELFDGAVTLESYKFGPMVINPKRTIEWFGKFRKPKDST
ncbi:MAG: hypothetical protein HRT35_19890 [Algicola sp.]|nr:hypothetical protein [Algicola sp.]